jgi:N-methylhydantoinase A/oxoprolinase/acetone carboxylase beta subunit
MRRALLGVRVAIDIGGTFTDIVVLSSCGVLHESKIATTPVIRAGPWSAGWARC